MKIRLTVLFLCLLAPYAGAQPQPRPGPQPAVRRQLDAAYARLNDALKHNNPRQLLQVLQDILAPGQMRDLMLSGTKRAITAGGDPGLKRTLAHAMRITALTVNGNQATATILQTADTIRIDRQGLYGAKGRTHRVQGTMTYRDTWAKLHGKWLLTATQPLRQQILVDGKPRKF